MKAFRFAIRILFVCCLCISEVRGTVLKEDSFLLRGSVANVSGDAFELTLSHPVRQETYTVSLDRMGRFCKRLPVVGMQDVQLLLFDAIPFSVCPGDTVEIVADMAAKTFRLSGTNAVRDREWRLEKSLYDRFRAPYRELLGLSRAAPLSVPLPDTVWEDAVEYAKGYLQMIADYETSHGSIPHKYYLMQRGVFDALGCIVRRASIRQMNALLDRCYMPGLDPYIRFNAPGFNVLQHPSCVAFMETRILLFRLTFQHVFGFREEHLLSDLQSVAPLMQNDTTREWYLLKCFHDEVIYDRASLSRIRPLQQWLDGQFSIPFFRAFYEKLKLDIHSMPFPGAKAPDFTLKDLHGNPVSLRSLRGKYVYLDFWNTGCAPCIREFQKLPEVQKQNRALSDSICYLSVCLGQSEEAWKKRCAALKHEGIHLYASSEKDPEIAAYRIASFPSYWLIDPNGTILSTSFFAPSELGDFRKSIDLCRKELYEN